MRMLILSSAYPKAGNSSYAFVHTHAKMYEKNSQKVSVFVPSDRNVRTVFEGINVYRGGVCFFRNLVRDFDPDIVTIHAPFYLANREHLRSLRENDIPIVAWIHGSEVLFHAFLQGYVAPWELKSKIRSVLLDPLKITLLRHLIQELKAVVYVSKWMKTSAERSLFFKHPYSFVIPNPIDTELFSFERKYDEVMHKGLAVRNLGWKYGLDVAIRAYSKLHSTHLTILGSGPLEYYLKILAQNCQSNVSFSTDHIDHNKMPEIYHDFGYFVAPSRVEAQGVAMCEAMACGLPIVATNVGGIPEFVRNEINGLLVQPEKPLALRQAILRLMNDRNLYERLSENGQDFVKKYLSSEVIYAKELSLFKQCIEKR